MTIPSLNAVELIGYLASLLVFSTFSMKIMHGADDHPAFDAPGTGWERHSPGTAGKVRVSSGKAY
jgi:hypothetical protein